MNTRRTLKRIWPKPENGRYRHYITPKKHHAKICIVCIHNLCGKKSDEKIIRKNEESIVFKTFSPEK